MTTTSSYPQLLGVAEGLGYLHSCNVTYVNLEGVYDITFPGTPPADGDKRSQISSSIHQEPQESRILVTPESLEIKILTVVGFGPLRLLHPRSGRMLPQLPRNQIYSHLGWS